MNYYLTNDHRKCMGITPVDDKCDILIFKEDKTGEEYHLFFDGDDIKKVVLFTDNEYELRYRESDVNYKTAENRTVVLPKTNRGKVKKLNISAIHSMNGIGTYFSYSYSKNNNKASISIGNYDIQRTFFCDRNVNNCDSFEKLLAWCDGFVKDSTDEDVFDAQQFSKQKRQHIKYKEGDYFRVKIGRHKYTYGRILADIYSRIKQGVPYWNVFMGRTLIVEAFHILTDRKDMSVSELQNLPTFPSIFMMDNAIYYGDYEIIGNGELPSKPKYPIMYGRSISYIDKNKIIFQCGDIHEELPYSEDALVVPYTMNDNSIHWEKSFINNGSSWSIKTNREVIERCIKEKSNSYYWKYYRFAAHNDLRSPQNAEKLQEVLRQVNHMDLLSIYRE